MLWIPQIDIGINHTPLGLCDKVKKSNLLDLIAVALVDGISLLRKCSAGCLHKHILGVETIVVHLA